MSDQPGDSTPLERLIFSTLTGGKRFEFSLKDLEPEDIDRILYAFLSVHVFGSQHNDTPESDENLSAIRKLCEVSEIEPAFETREYPAMKRGKVANHKIILLPDSGNPSENEKKALSIIKFFSGLEITQVTEAIITLIERFDENDIVKYVERYNASMRTEELQSFKERMKKRKATRLNSNQF